MLRWMTWSKNDGMTASLAIADGGALFFSNFTVSQSSGTVSPCLNHPLLQLRIMRLTHTCDKKAAEIPELCQLGPLLPVVFISCYFWKTADSNIFPTR